jgi:hypothetical protein
VLDVAKDDDVNDPHVTFTRVNNIRVVEMHSNVLIVVMLMSDDGGGRRLREGNCPISFHHGVPKLKVNVLILVYLLKPLPSLFILQNPPTWRGEGGSRFSSTLPKLRPTNITTLQPFKSCINTKNITSEYCVWEVLMGVLQLNHNSYNHL